MCHPDHHGLCVVLMLCPQCLFWAPLLTYDMMCIQFFNLCYVYRLITRVDKFVFGFKGNTAPPLPPRGDKRAE